MRELQNDWKAAEWNLCGRLVIMNEIVKHYSQTWRIVSKQKSVNRSCNEEDRNLSIFDLSLSVIS
jgi:hypothetical protein